MSGFVRVCRECGEQYRPDVAVCADCGGDLENRPIDEEGRPIAVEAAIEAATPAEDAARHRVLFVTSRAAELVPLAEALREADVGHRLLEQAPALGDRKRRA